ncbi:hypothetical protein DLAC_10241 [Tieghemostelium lacteum]|uniref:Uncharacterized protein n=1 Tax=Tieghemostelium lacteum TaxID=361077 RepID=A0A151Z4Y2_TIELA|nr:hypothetical protein DLAC_10241 [Tieghemostelium lacteum]|eukprot:KYQ89020.1 hypothetical protein DLAC_10241 [Tieghemostelium lacteum]
MENHIEILENPVMVDNELIVCSGFFDVDAKEGTFSEGQPVHSMLYRELVKTLESGVALTYKLSLEESNTYPKVFRVKVTTTNEFYRVSTETRYVNTFTDAHNIYSFLYKNKLEDGYQLVALQ